MKYLIIDGNNITHADFVPGEVAEQAYAGTITVINLEEKTAWVNGVSKEIGEYGKVTA